MSTQPAVSIPQRRPRRPPRFGPEQVADALRQVEAGVSPAEVCHRLSVSERTLLRWRRTHRSPAAPPAVAVQLASARLQIAALQHALGLVAAGVGLEAAARSLRARFGMSTWRARRLLGLPPRSAAPDAAPAANDEAEPRSPSA